MYSLNCNIKWFFLFLAVLSTIQLHPQTVNRGNEIVLNSTQLPLRTVLENISTQTGINFIYNDSLVDNTIINCSIKSSVVEEILNRILSRHELSYKTFDNNIVLYKERKGPKEFYNATIVSASQSSIDTIQSIIKPTIISKNKLYYPEEAVRSQVEGKVIVKLFIDGQGDVKRSLILRSSGFSVLDSASIDYSRVLKFLPAEANGKPKEIWMTMEFRYSITRD